jgi:hypothetical protein
MRTTRALATALCAALVVACAPEETPPADDPAPAPPGEPTVVISPTTGAPGSEVTVEATGFPPDTEMEIGFGPPDAWYDEIDRVRTGADGRAEVRVTVPSVDREGEYVFVVSEADARNGVQAASERFTLQAGTGGEREQPREGQVRIRGQVTDEGVECPAVRADADNALYTLAGAPDWVEPGVRVEVEGPVAEMSICMQGTTIQVERIERLD